MTSHHVGNAISARTSVPEIARQGHEQLLDRHDARNEMLLGHVLHECLKGWPVGLYAIGPGIAAEHVVDFLDAGLLPWQHRGTRARITQARERATFRFHECLIETGCKPAMLRMERTSAGDEWHDR